MRFRADLYCVPWVFCLASAMLFTSSMPAQRRPIVLRPSHFPKQGTVDSRFLSYNIEMVEVTGGRFWKPYKNSAESFQSTPIVAQPGEDHPVGESSGPYQSRPPIDLSNPRLRKLAAALAPSYLRVSGTWQNSTFFQDDDAPALKQSPEGFTSVLTRAEWKGVIDFAHAVDARIVTSFAISPGTRDAAGLWTPTQAKAILEFTRRSEGNIAAAEFMNEPTFPGPGGAPKDYGVPAFARDVKLFSVFLREQSPDTILLGPGGVGEGVSLVPAGTRIKLLSTEEILKATGPIFDAFSYHFYGGVSKRCAGSIKLDQALDAEWIDRTEIAEQFYSALRDKYMLGKQLWLTETGEAACGGDPFAGQYADVFRFLNQLGSLAQRGVQVVAHNTLAASDYGLLDEETFAPKPDYWAALLWKRSMGSVVLDPGRSADESIRVFAHCLPGAKGGVGILALNTDADHDKNLHIDGTGLQFTLTASELTSTKIRLNGIELRAGRDGTLPLLRGDNVGTGTVLLPRASVTFLEFAGARNKSCM